MQNDNIRQSLMLWLIYYTKQQVVPRNFRSKDVLVKMEKITKTAGVENIELFHKTDDYYTLKYNHKNMEKIVQFTVEEVKSLMEEQF